METFSALLALCVGNSPVTGYSPHKGQALMFSLTCAWTNIWVKNRNACDLRRNHVHNDITVMDYCLISGQQDVETNGAKWIIIWQLFFLLRDTEFTCKFNFVIPYPLISRSSFLIDENQSKCQIIVQFRCDICCLFAMLLSFVLCTL